MTEHLGHEKHRAPEERASTNIRNGTRAKTVLTRPPGMSRSTSPRPGRVVRAQIVKKQQRRLTGVDEIALSLDAKGLTTGEISAHFAEIYSASVSKETISRITDKVIVEMDDWANRPFMKVCLSVTGGLRPDGVRTLSSVGPRARPGEVRRWRADLEKRPDRFPLGRWSWLGVGYRCR